VRGQSDALGFVFVFALIVLTVGTVYTVGYATLQDARDTERISNMERAFEVMDDNIEDITRHGAPSRATELSLAGGSVVIGEATRLSIEATNTSDPADNASFATTTRPIAYVDDETAVVYSFGAVFRSDRGSSLMLTEPNWLLGSDRAVVPLVVGVAGDGPTSLGGSTTVLVVTERRASGLAGSFTAGDGASTRVNVTIESPRADAWASYFASEGMTEIDPPDDTDGNGVTETTYQFVTGEFYLTRTSVDIRLSP